VFIKNNFIFHTVLFVFVSFICNYKTYSQVDNLSPFLTSDVATVDMNQELSVPSGAPDYYANLLDNDIDPEGEPLEIIGFSVDGISSPPGAAIALASGYIKIFADGTYTFIPTLDYSGPVPNISYTVSDGEMASTAMLLLTVESTDPLIEIAEFSSCNQGYTVDGEYVVRYKVTLENISITRGYHKNSEISEIQIFNNLNATFGNICISKIDLKLIKNSYTYDFVGGYYPREWNTDNFDEAEFNAVNATPGNDGILDDLTKKLYPRQKMDVEFCIHVDPFCNGRPNPTLSGSNINFDSFIKVESSKGEYETNLIITDFHTPKTTVAASIYTQDLDDEVFEAEIHQDSTYDYTTRVLITNDGNSVANNVNFNLGLKRFIDSGVIFNSIDITQVSGPSVVTNINYDGLLETVLLGNGESLNSGETIILEIHFNVYIVQGATSVIYFKQLETSMTQGDIDGQGNPPIFENEFDVDNKASLSYVFWSDDTGGNHVDRYYRTNISDEIPSSNSQCKCDEVGIRLLFAVNAGLEKAVTITNESYNGINEFKEVAFELKLTNVSRIVNVKNLQIHETLDLICDASYIISVSEPIIINSIATEEPIINTNFDGLNDNDIFNGTTGFLKPEDLISGIAAEFVTVQFKVVFRDDVFGESITSCSVTDEPELNSVIRVSNEVNIRIFSNNDNDSIINTNDIDDDNDGIPDVLEYNGMDPLLDHDGDYIPNYEDIDFSSDVNNDGIIDVFDFDMDGVPNHYDLDSDNDGIFDIVEARNGQFDINNDGIVNTDTSNNGLADPLESSDDYSAVINYILPNEDIDANFNFLDIDSDNDGIVDNIEAQLTQTYIAPFPIDNYGRVYPNGLNPTDTDGDSTPDFFDLDSDNDTIVGLEDKSDSIEGWDTNNDGIAETTISFPFSDMDGDGLDDAFDADNVNFNATNNQVPTDFPDLDNPGNDRDWREKTAIILQVDNVSVVEGNTLNFTISLVSLNNNNRLMYCPTDVNIDVFTTDGTNFTDQYDVAKKEFDYVEIENIPPSITIPIGEKKVNVSVITNDDNIDEIKEYLTLNILVTSNNTINPSTGNIETNILVKGIGEIKDNLDDLPPNIEMNNATVEEGDDLEYRISLSNPSSRPIVVEIKTLDDTAESPNDYLSFSNNITFEGSFDPSNPDNISRTFQINTVDDIIDEPLNENLQVNGQVINGIVSLQDLEKTGTIVDNDDDAELIISNAEIVEGNILQFEVSLTTPSSVDTKIELFTNDGTARSPNDYIAYTDQIMIPSESIKKVIKINTIDDKLVEEDENFVLKGIVISSNTINIEAEGEALIFDNEQPNLFSPNDDGLSDLFELKSLSRYPNFNIKIFNRTGNLVYNYSNNGKSNPIWWDGKLNKNPVPEGVYYYALDYNDGKTNSISGFIELVR